MKNFNNYLSTVLMAFAFANLPTVTPCFGQAPDPTPNVAEQAQVLTSEDPGVLPVDQADRFSSAIAAQAAAAQVRIIANGRVTSQTNAVICEKRQAVALQVTGPQLLTFLQSLAESNSVLRVRDLTLRPTPDGAQLVANVLVLGHYRLPPGGKPPKPKVLKIDYQVLNERRHLRSAALDCYIAVTESLPAGWTLEALKFGDGNRLSLQGNAPADQVSSLEDVRTKLQAAKGRGGEDLFDPSASQATMRMAEPGRTSFSWEIELELQPGPLR
jgi:hypothetical protein